MGNRNSLHQDCELTTIDRYSSLRRGDELINGIGVHGIFLGQHHGVAVVYELFGKQYVYTHDLFQFDRPELSLRRIDYNDDNTDKRELIAYEAEQKIASKSVGTNILSRFIPLWICSHKNIRSVLNSSEPYNVKDLHPNQLLCNKDIDKNLNPRESTLVNQWFPRR